MRWVGVLLVVCLVYGQALRVIDEEGLPVRGAAVTTEVAGKKLRFVTDSLGAVSLEAGLYEVGVVAEGFFVLAGAGGSAGHHSPFASRLRPA
jgi:hypothetical protein